MRCRFLGFAHVLVGKPVPTFPGHAPVGRLKDQREDRTTAGIVANLHASAVRLHREAEPGALSRAILAAPETIEDVPTFRRRKAGTAIDDMDDAPAVSAFTAKQE